MSKAQKDYLPWKECKLGEVVAIISERTSINDASLENYISTENMISNFGGVQIADKLPVANTINSFQKEDVLFSNIRTYFKKVWCSTFSGTVSPDVLVFRANGCDKKFLYYQMCNPEFTEYTVLTSRGAKMPRGDKEAISQYDILLPPLPEQQAIAGVLSSLDDKIDLLHRQNKTLEAMAETLFRQWFVEPCKNGLPEGWEEGKLPDEFEFTMGQSPSGTSFNEEGVGIPMFQGNADFGFRFPSKRVYTTEPTRFAEPLDTLISVRAPVGEQNMALVKCCIGRGIAAFSYKENKDYYTYTYFKIRSFMNEIKQFNDEGTVFGSIGKSDFEALDITVPPRSLIKNFEQTTKPINDKVIENCKQIRTLEKFRDTLLPKLMSGEVRCVETAETRVKI